MRKECKFCENCGTPYKKLVWPRSCKHCGHIVYLNPVAASIAMVPVDDTLLYLKRAIEPKIGSWAMPSGYMDVAESAEETAARELQEETGIIIPADRFSVFGPTHKTVSGLIVLIFCIANIKPLRSEELEDMISIDPVEVLDVAPYNSTMNTAFPLQDSVLQNWYRRNH